MVKYYKMRNESPNVLPQGRALAVMRNWQKSCAKRQISNRIYIVLITSPSFIYISFRNVGNLRIIFFVLSQNNLYY